MVEFTRRSFTWSSFTTEKRASIAKKKGTEILKRYTIIIGEDCEIKRLGSMSGATNARDTRSLPKLRSGVVSLMFEGVPFRYIESSMIPK